jgi:hypothetical protein
VLIWTNSITSVKSSRSSSTAAGLEGRRVNQRRARPEQKSPQDGTQGRWGRGLTARRTLEWGGYLPLNVCAVAREQNAPKVNCVRPTSIRMDQV